MIIFSLVLMLLTVHGTKDDVGAIGRDFCSIQQKLRGIRR